MKKMKRLASLLLVAVMALAMSMTAFAAETKGSITVSNPQEGQTYTAYKIFDVTYNADKTSYSYSIAGTSEWYSVVKNYDGVTLTKSTNGDVYVVKNNDNYSAAAFANVLKAAVDGKTGITLTADGDQVSADNLSLGYYFVSSSTGALCNLTTTKPDATIRDKNDMPFDKTDDKSTVEVGETVNYTITGKVPDTTGFNTYTYEIKDTMSEGLTFNKDVKVYVNSTLLDAGKYTLTQNESNFTLSIKVMELQDLVGKEIKVTYSAITNDKAVAVVSKNKAELNYSNDPTDGNKTTKITDEETVFSAKIVIDKYKEGDEATKLKDAKFVLKNANDATAKYYKYDAVAKKVEWVDDKADATEVTTDANGAASFVGLKNGAYYLEETASPDGYNMLTDTVKVTINGEDTDVNTLIATAKVANNTGLTLPETGGMGTTIFYVLGSLLTIGTAVILVTKKRMITGR